MYILMTSPSGQKEPVVADTGSAADRRHIEKLWHDRLIEARRKYDLAVAETRLAGEDFRTRQLPTPDGGANLVGALKAESQVRDEYMRVLRIFSDLVLQGERPKE
jgi:hypothetical protein